VPYEEFARLATRSLIQLLDFAAKLKKNADGIEFALCPLGPQPGGLKECDG
jgi:hypothetical protein